METVALLYEDYQKELAEDFKNTFLKRASDTDSSRSNDTVIDEVTDMLSTNIAVYTEKLLQRWGFSSGGEGGGGGDVTVTLDDLLKKYLSDNYVTIKGDQEVFGEKDFRKGIRIAGRRLYWDEGNDALVIEGAAYTTRWLSAKGVSPGGGGAGSGGAAAMYQLIDVSPNDTKDAVLGAEKDYVLTFDGSFWRGMPNKGGLSSKLFTALDKEGNEVNPDDENAEIYAIRANYSLWSVGFLSAKGISDGGTGGGGGGAVALYQLLDVEKNADITGVAGATKGSVLTFNGAKWYADKPKTAAGISNLFTALDNDGNEVDLNDESKLGTITNIRANYALWSVDWISAKGKSSGGSGGGGGLINLVYGFESLGGTFDNNDNSATFNAFTINEIWKLASSGLTNVTVTGSGNAVTDVIKGSDGRSLTFTKGSTFATKSEFDALNTKFNDFLTGSDADDIINKWSELEVFLQGMKESDNLAVILQSKMDKTAFSKLFTALDASGNEVDPSDDTKTIASIRANFGFWGVDYISAKGVSKGSGGTGGASTLYQLVDVLANDTEDGVEGAAAGKALVFDGTHWRAGDAGLNESQLYSYLTANKYLTQSAADSRYVTSSRKVIAGTGLSGGGALTSDVTLSLGTSGVVAGTYTKVMVDAYGRVTSGTNLSATDIPNLDWSKITTGKPTTLAGYGITDAVTLTTAQTISGRKTFSQNIVFNNNGGITYTDSNVVLRNSDGHTILASFGNGEINLRPNGHNNTEGAVWINKKGNVQAPSVSTNTITIGDAQLVYDSKNKALRVKHRTDGNTVGFYSDGWITALGVQTGGAGGGSGVIKTVYSFANLTDGTTFSDSDLNNTFNAYTVKEIWKMAKEGGGIKNIAQSGSGNAITDMTLSSDGKTITAVFGETFARQQDLGTLNNTVTQLSNKLNNFLEGLTGNDTLTELLALKADKTITISAGTGLTGGGNLSANRTLSLATTGVKAGTYTKVTVDTYGRVTVGDNPTTLAGYGITDAYTKTEADGKYVTIATPQTITGQKTFTKNIAMNSGIGLSYSGNTVFRNTSGNTVISSYGDSGMLYFRPNGDTSDVGVVQINKQGHINGVSAGFKGGVSAARLSATEYVQIGDAYLKWDAANNAVYVIKKDGTTPVGFYSTDWLSAKGVSMSGAQTGTLDSLNDVKITDPVNGQALKYDAASKKWVNGTIDSFNVNQMWAELKKADSSKVIDASHIPTSVLDGRWVKKAGDTMTGTLTSASSSGSIVFKGVENCDITNIYKDNGVIRNDDGGLTSIRNGLRFNWYDTYWYIGNLRGSSTESAGFGVVDHNNKLVLRVTPNDVRAPRFMSTVATGLSPLIVSSNTTVDNLSADLLDGYHAFGTSNALIKYGYTVGGTEPAWCRIATYSIRNTETMTDVCFVLHSSFSDLFGLLVVKTIGTAVVEGLLIASYNINRSNIRIYHDAEKKNIELYCYGGSNYSIIQANLLYSHNRNGGANTNITLYQADTKAPSWSTYVNPVFANLQNSSEVAKKLQTPRTLWGQSFDGTANVSGDMTGVGSITMSGDLKIGNATSPNTIYFYGTTGDGPGGYNHTFIAERFWGGTESSELVLFKGNDIGNDNEAVNVSNSGPDRIRHIAAAHLFQTYTSPLAGSVEDVCTSSALKSLFGIAANRVTSYVPFMSTVASGTAPFIVVSNTVVGNLNADMVDGFHAERFLLSVGRSDGTFDLNTYSERAIKEIRTTEQTTNNAPFAGYGLLANLWDSNKFAALQIGGTSTDLFFRGKHDGTNKITSAWHRLLHTENYASIADGRYVKKSGDTMTGDLTMNNTKGFNIGWSTRVVKDSGVWIHGGADAASSADANLRFGSWYGIGWYPTFSGGSVAQGNNAMWLNVRNGNLDTRGAITAHTNYLAANWDSARRLVLGGGSSYAYIDSRNSSNNVLCNIVLEDNKVFIGNYAESSRFVSTVGTGTAPYQCSSTTLNTNLNADLLDNWHIMDIPRNYNSTATYSLQFALGGTDNNWKKIFACSESGAGPYRSVTVWGRIWYAYGNHAQDEVRSYHFCAIFQMRSGPSASDSNVGDISNSARLYLPTFAKGMDNIRLVRVGTNNFELQVRQIGSYNNGYIQYQYWANGANVSAWRGLQSTSNTSVAVSAGGASTLADSRASSADVWTTARTFYIQDYHSANTGAGVSVNGGSNCYLKLPSTTRFSRIDFSTPNANIRHSGNDNGNEVGSSTLSNLVIDSWYGVSFTTTCSSTYQNKIAMSVNCRTGRVTANNFHAATNITANGAITAKASSSDIRLKTDIQGYDAMGIIRKFRSVKYHWNAIAKENSEVFNHDNWNYGLIAQDLLSGGYSQWVKDAFNDYYTIDYERLIPVVWKGLQEVDDEVTKLKREVARLNKRVKELEKSLCA
nr:MAG: chaperone of endosialidase [Bacteriophage sp.]